ncbi:Kef-type K+ transport system NAD-binding protein [Oleiphilus messinensis]|uniref:Kef-type K+ transport system NAD-binding protein n=1 Tax=Oleiphilus messinensis TaxID=141451 RepID=A0A1Y0ICH7_9GAMM|nr:ion channel [Oleiphilus messinensis]ARU58227.1 Kef-type K+ transport system NAD-binding protein [Oleiphilus messinensis]
MDLRWYGVALYLLLYVGFTYAVLWAAGEDALLSLEQFPYWLVVTASTVGYGDLSPSTLVGKWFVSFFVIPFGLGLFALLIGRVAAWASTQWKKGVRGLKTLDIADHILVIGWYEQRTLQLIRMLLREQQGAGETKPIVLCTKSDIENPLPEQIGFVKVESYNSEPDMARAGLERASVVIIDTPADDVTMTAALYCKSRNPEAHMIAYFKDESLSDLLKIHCPNIECTPSVDLEMLVKAAMDPGSSLLHHELLNVEQGMTQYSLRYCGEKDISAQALFVWLKETYEATLIAISAAKGKIQVNPPNDTRITPGTVLYYIADERIDGIKWSSSHV